MPVQAFIPGIDLDLAAHTFQRQPPVVAALGYRPQALQRPPPQLPVPAPLPSQPLVKRRTAIDIPVRQQLIAVQQPIHRRQLRAVLADGHRLDDLQVDLRLAPGQLQLDMRALDL